jgi:hypothetical protein
MFNIEAGGLGPGVFAEICYQLVSIFIEDM